MPWLMLPVAWQASQGGSRQYASTPNAAQQRGNHTGSVQIASTLVVGAFGIGLVGKVSSRVILAAPPPRTDGSSVLLLVCCSVQPRLSAPDGRVLKWPRLTSPANHRSVHGKVLVRVFAWQRPHSSANLMRKKTTRRLLESTLKFGYACAIDKLKWLTRAGLCEP